MKRRIKSILEPVLSRFVYYLIRHEFVFIDLQDISVRPFKPVWIYDDSNLIVVLNDVTSEEEEKYFNMIMMEE